METKDTKKWWKSKTILTAIVTALIGVYSAVAITNARLYTGMAERDQALTQRNEDLSLINHMGASMAGSLELDDILHEILKLVMEYIGVDEGEIYLSEEGGHIFRLGLHLGEEVEAF